MVVNRREAHPWLDVLVVLAGLMISALAWAWILGYLG